MIALLVGDSHVNGDFGDALAADLVKLAGPELEVEVLATDGKGVQFFVDSLGGAGSPVDPSTLALVVVGLGSNDHFRNHDTFAHSVAELAATIEEWSSTARLVWISAPLMSPADATWQVEVLEDMLSDRWTIVDSTALTGDLPTADGIHRRGAAAVTWAQRVMDALVAGDGGTSRTAARWLGVGAAVVVGGVFLASFVRHLARRR